MTNRLRGIWFGILFGLTICFVQWQSAGLPIELGFLVAGFTGVMFGLCMALFYYWRTAKVKLPRLEVKWPHLENSDRTVGCCSFCRKSYLEVGPLVEGPVYVYICGKCIEFCRKKQSEGVGEAMTPKSSSEEDSHASIGKGCAAGKSGRTTYCSFCRKSYLEVGSLVEGPGEVYICTECIELCQSIIDQEKRRRGLAQELSFPSPEKIEENLDQYVIGWQLTKKTLSAAVHNHYQRLGQRSSGDGPRSKSHILLIGPTESSKVLLARALAHILDVPVAFGNAARLTEAGYVSEDVESLLLKLLLAADFDIELAQRGIVSIDGVDHLAKISSNVSSGEGRQQALLKMLEGTISNVPPPGDRNHPEQHYIQLDTTNILFICGGRFVGLEEIVGRRVGKDATRGECEWDDLLHDVTRDDLIEFGMLPELASQLPVIVPVAPLDEATLLRILSLGVEL